MLYAVRIIEDKQPVGFFWSDSIRDLRYAADAVTPVSGCEYKAVQKNGGIVWEDRINSWKMGVKGDAHPGEDEEEKNNYVWSRSLRGMRFLDLGKHMVFDFLNTDEVDGWKPLA